jgi:hypothetical protein
MRRILLGLVAAVAIYEVVALINSDDDDTISDIVWDAARRPIVPFVGGMIAAHFFWQREP